jgi:hypothetical protein
MTENVKRMEAKASTFFKKWKAAGDRQAIAPPGAE